MEGLIGHLAHAVLQFVLRHTYAAMFGILFLCGVGLPVPEEVTLVASGILVGLDRADFFLASATCVVAIIAGDSMIFLLGRHYGQSFLDSRFLRRVFHPRRQKFAREFFNRRRNRAVFFARFFAGVRVGVYAIAGTSGMRWATFAFLDFLGAMISGPTSVWIGKFAVERFASTPDEALDKAREWAHEFQHVIWIILAVAALVFLALWLYKRKRRSAAGRAHREPGDPREGGPRRSPSSPAPAPAEPPAAACPRVPAEDRPANRVTSA